MSATSADLDDCQRFVADQIRFLEQPFEIPDDFYAVDDGIPKRVLDGFARRLNIELRKKGLASFSRQAQHELFRTLKIIQLAQKPVENVVRVTLPPTDPCKYESLWQRVAERQQQLRGTLIKHQHYQALSVAASQLDVTAMQQTIDLRLHDRSRALEDLNRADLGRTVGTRTEPIRVNNPQGSSTFTAKAAEAAVLDMLGHPDYVSSLHR
ncbi:hypothetical protein H4R35_001910 [Dimargaris xerosporica]|nr:hypothetical protein H4R35_001910 [Dimargaris xerosporica]